MIKFFNKFLKEFLRSKNDFIRCSFIYNNSKQSFLQNNSSKIFLKIT